MWSGPRNVTVTKLSADAAVICWKFPLAAGAQGYVLRYWRHPASLSPTQPLTPTENEAPDSAPIPLELKIIDLDGRANLSVSRACHFCFFYPCLESNLFVYQQTTKDEIRTVCSSLKQLESEAAYKLQVLACGGDAECGDSLGPASAILHFTTQTNRKRFAKSNRRKEGKKERKKERGWRRVVKECMWDVNRQ